MSARAESLLREGERAHELGLELSRQTDAIRRDLEGAVRACSGPDRSLCAVIDSSGIRLDLRIERVNKLDTTDGVRRTGVFGARSAGQMVPDDTPRRQREEFLSRPLENISFIPAALRNLSK